MRSWATSASSQKIGAFILSTLSLSLTRTLGFFLFQNILLISFSHIFVSSSSPFLHTPFSFASPSLAVGGVSRRCSAQSPSPSDLSFKDLKRSLCGRRERGGECVRERERERGGRGRRRGKERLKCANQFRCAIAAEKERHCEEPSRVLPRGCPILPSLTLSPSPYFSLDLVHDLSLPQSRSRLFSHSLLLPLTSPTPI